VTTLNLLEEMFDDRCPVELRFDAPAKKFKH